MIEIIEQIVQYACGRSLRVQETKSIEELPRILEQIYGQRRNVLVRATISPTGITRLPFSKTRRGLDRNDVEILADRFIDDAKNRGRAWYSEVTHKSYVGGMSNTHYLTLESGFRDTNDAGKEIGRTPLNKANIVMSLEHPADNLFPGLEL